MITVAYVVPPDEHWLLMAIAIGLAAVASVPQFVLNVQQGHTGRLSLVSLVLQLADALASVGKPTPDSIDQAELVAQTMRLVLNAALVIQVLHYWKATDTIACTPSPAKKAN